VQTISPVSGAPRASTSWSVVEVLSSDVPSSIVVSLVALPLCLGIALASGAPLYAGLLAGVVGGLIVGPLSGSHVMVSGPAAGLTAVVLQATTKLGTFSAVAVAVAIAGVLQLGLGLARAGFLARYLPRSVITGMLTAIGVLLILKQVPHLVGYDADAEGELSFLQPDGETTLSELAGLGSRFLVGPMLAGLSALAVLVVWPKTPLARQRWVPPALGAVLVGTAVAAGLPLLSPQWAIASTHRVVLPPAADVVAGFSLPDVSFLLRGDVWLVAVTLAVVASLETLLSLEATDKLDRHRRRAPADRELFAQGAGNLLSGLLGGLPVTGVIVRSSANADAGAKTRWSAILHGVWLLIAVLALPQVLEAIPLSALAAVLIHTGFKLTPPSVWRGAWRAGKDTFLPFAATVVAIVFTDLLTGICLGLAVGTAFILREHARAPALIPVGPEGAVLKRFALSRQATFLARPGMEKQLAELPERSRVEIDGRQTERIDRDVLETLHAFAAGAAARDIEVRLVGVPALEARS